MNDNHAGERQGVPLRILLVEDSYSFTKLLIAQLRAALKLKHTVIHHDNLKAGLDVLSHDPPDLVILDLHLPDSHGLETFQSVHQLAGDIPVVILSSDDSEQTAMAALKLGADDYLVKGEFDPEKLSRFLRFSMERKRRITAERELDAASIIQKSLLPQEDPNIPGVTVAGAMFPAVQTAGDYYDWIFPVPANPRLAFLVVADVSGHGYGPAILMAETRGCIRAFTHVETDPARILKLTHDVISSRHHSHFITMFLACIDTVSKTITYASAGHEGVIVRGDGDIEVLESTGLPLALDVDEPLWETHGPIPLQQDDTVLIVTDGVFEYENQEHQLFGKERLFNFIRDCPGSPEQKIAELRKELIVFGDGVDQSDDITILIAEVS